MRIALLVLAGLLWSAQALAEPAFAHMYKSRYGYQPSCNACHTDGGGSKRNPYGMAFENRHETDAALVAIEKIDSDGDGFANIDEINAKANPGDASSTPKKPGDWLDTGSLIPKQVQAVFPGVQAYLPMDTMLTQDEIARAAGMGAALSKHDANTIYIPLSADRHPLGTAIIAPGSYHDKLFFILLATDARLNVKAVSIVDARHVPALKKSKLLTAFTGKNLKTLPAASGDDLDAALTRAVKTAGTLVYVRLKKN